MTPSAELAERFGLPLWDGSPGRLEVWYATFTDVATGTGYWLHYETVAPATSALRTGHSPTEPYAHGWAAVFAKDARPRCERFGPEPARSCKAGVDAGGGWVTTNAARVGPGVLQGSAGGLSWDVSFEDPGGPLFTFGRAAWERRLLPGAQCAPWPLATFRGTFTIDGAAHDVHGHGAVARIYGHSNAERWCWLHADLAEGAVLELVSATARRQSLRRLPPLAMVQLRLPGEPDWPRVPVLAAPFLRTQLGDSRFTVSGRSRIRHLEIDVTLHPERSVKLTYTDPDGKTATCTNSEVADATVLYRSRGEERTWELRGRAHAEIGRRP